MAVWGVGVMVGPILEPTLGDYLTDAYNWRWVFLINVPFGILAYLGLRTFMRETSRHEDLKFDWTGFAVLSLGLASLQLMLDRGEQQDWFHSTEIIAELVVACLGIYLFIVHLFTTDTPFMPPRIFRDVNFAAGFLIMFAIGMILLSSMALLPPYLQNLGGYSITSTGLLMAPRGLGTMLAMVLAGRLSSRVDPRLLMFAGILMICASMWSMVGWTPDVDAWSLALTTFTQGIGLGFVFIPLQVVAFATCPPTCAATARPYSASSATWGARSASPFRRSCWRGPPKSCTRIVEGLTPSTVRCKTVAPTFFGTAQPRRAERRSMPR